MSTWTCPTCGKKFKDHGRRIIHQCVSSACIHRLPPAREVDCQLCGDREVKKKVYGCEIHGECMEQRYKSGRREHPRLCSECQDFRSGFGQSASPAASLQASHLD